MTQKLEKAVEAYFSRLHALRSTGGTTAETSLYSALEGLLNEIGGHLRPKVFCVPQLASHGAGHPDFGLYTAGQCQKGEPKPGQKPERGVVEVKGAGDDTLATAETAQVSRYWSAYRLVLVTNYRDFVLIGEDASGRAARLEGFRLAATEAEFWSRAQQPRKFAREIGGSFGEYLRRVLTHSVSLGEPRDVAWFLASYARDALGRVEDKGDLPALKSVRTALEQALGVTFEGERGDHFFKSTLVQTLFYGVFSAWVLWSRQTPPPTAPFDWRAAVWHLKVPMLQALFQQVSDPGRLRALDLVELLDWAGAALNRIDRPAFFARFRDAEAVQYFYEPFLEAFDPDLRKQLGVWYTPPEVVRYMVARVDRALKDDLGIADGLAAENVYILDPCTGTGSFLAETLRRIADNLADKGFGALRGAMVRKAATERVFGFEIMPAPFVVAHLQIGLVLQSMQAALADDGSERAGVYLTNALTGWEPASEEKQRVAFPEMEAERDLANDVKRDKPILVILGNPPYNGYAGMAVDEERALSEVYRTTRRVRRPEGQGLNDLYVRFFRMAERRIAEKSGEGVVCFVSNYSWLDGLSFTGMRERYLEAFDAIRIDCLNGDKYKTGKVAPDGRPDPSIFSTEHNREGIQVGAAIATLVRRRNHAPGATVAFRHLWGPDKRRRLAEDADAADIPYESVEPNLDLGLPYIDAAVSAGYFDWPRLPELLPTSFPGVKTSRDEFLVDVDRDRLHRRIAEYFDPTVPDAEIARKHPSVMRRAGRFDGPAVRAALLKRGSEAGRFVRYAYRPFDTRWLYWDPDTDLLDRERSDYMADVRPGNSTIVAQQMPRRDWSCPLVISTIGCLDLFDRSATCFPVQLRDDHDPDGPGRPNLSKSVAAQLAALDAGVGELFHHIVAVLHSPAYRAENAGALRMDWPRIPMPDDAAALADSAALGRDLAALLDAETPVAGVDSGLRRELGALGVPSKRGGGELSASDLAVTAGWGSAQSGGVVMPGRGKTAERDYSGDELAAFDAGAGGLGLTRAEIVGLLGERTYDVWLNGDAFWTNVPAKVWEYRLGGYQVVKKWLSYRELAILGRPLRLEEAQYVTGAIRRIAAILLLTPRLDANYAKVKDGRR